MHPLPDIDLVSHYGSEFTSYKERFGAREYCFMVDDLLERLEHEKNPLAFRHQFFSLLQCAYREQHEDLSTLYDIGRRFVHGFYRGELEELDVYREVALNLSYESCGTVFSTPFHMSSTDGMLQVQKLGKVISTAISGKTLSQANFVPIATGGFESAFLLMDIACSDKFSVLNYSRIARRDKNITWATKNSLRDSSVFVIDDVVCSSKTMKKAMEMVAKEKPREIYAVAAHCVLLTSSWDFSGLVHKGEDPLIAHYKDMKKIRNLTTALRQ